MPDDCWQILATLSDKVEAWAKTTSETDAIGDHAACLDAKSATARAAEHCGLASGVDPRWCESQEWVHPRVILIRRERARACIELADHRDAQLDAWRTSASNPENAAYKKRLCLDAKESTENFNRQCAGVGGMMAQEVPAGWCESDSFDASSIRYIHRANR